MRHITTLLVVALSVTACRAEQSIADDSDVYLVAATRAGTWLQARWADGQGIPDRTDLAGSSAGLGGGASGRALFFAELYVATLDVTFLDSARREAEAALVGAIGPSEDYSLYGGLSGIAFSVSEVARIADDPRLAADARGLFDRIAAGSPSRGGAGWGGVNDVIGGAAGVGLGLIHAYERFGDPAFLDAAVEVGDRLLAVAESPAPGEQRWLRGVETPLDLPNFSHGTAGVGFFLARLGLLSGLARFATASAGAIAYLDSIVLERDGLFLVPYGVPNDGYSTPYDIGWAHGPAGTARLHYTEWAAVPNARTRHRLDAAARTILAAGVPGPSSDSSIWLGPFQIDRRFGTSGAAAFLLDLGNEMADDAYLDVGFRIADDIVARATVGSDGISWTVPLYGFQGGEGKAIFTGYFYGTAGLGLTLLQAHYTRHGERLNIRFPDDPFGRPLGG